jgi:hypothetical protein
MKKINVEIGAVYGRLTVLSEEKSKPGKIRVRVRCMCGKERVANHWNLRNGRSTSCGCQAKDTRRDNLIGQVFGRLTVIALAGKDPTTWLVRCEDGTEFVTLGAPLKDGRTRSCGCLKSDMAKERCGAKSPSWKGGRRIDGSGYVYLTDKTHPRSNQGYVYEHILVMEKHIGRQLLPGENVHHRNGVRHDNRVDNLELWSKHQPSGQRVIDKVKYAKEILRTYPPEILHALGYSDDQI